MCSECHMNPCHPHCPNAPEPKPVMYCDNCNQGICNGEAYYSFNGKIICEYCIDSCRYIADFDDTCELDAMDIWKAMIEKEMCDE